MGDNSTADPGAGGDTFRTKDRATAKTEVVGLDLTIGGGSETLMNGSMPVTNTGTFPVQADTELTTADLDSGVGTDTRAVVGLVYAASGGAQQIDTTHGLPVAAQGSFPVQVIAGTATFGKLAANSGVVIGDVNVATSALPSGASTAAKQPALGTAGTPSADVISVQGVASMTALKVDGSGVTQPVSGTVTASGPLTDTQLRASAVPVDTELPAAAALADGASNPTTPTLGAAGLLWNGTTWDRAKGDATNGAFVNVKAMIALPAGSNEIGGVNVTKLAGTAVDVNSGNKNAGTQRVVLATDQPALTNALKVDGSAVTQPVSGTVTSNPAASAAAAGYSKSHTVSAASTNATNVKASAGKLHGWYIYNSNAAARKVALHNTAGTPTAGTGVTDSIVIPPGSAANAFTDVGIAFSTGIAFTTVTGLADSDTTGVGANDLVINLYYV